jgi:phosphate transport system substrate-binding protein
MRRLALGLAAVALVTTSAFAGAARTPAPAVAAPASPARAAAAPARINGTGSSYVGLAMDLWTSEATTRGLDVNYTQSGSPQGLRLFADRSTDFAGTEAEFSSLGITSESGVTRGFQYVPDVAGAVAVMYNIDDRAGRKVDYLRLSRSTVAKIFMGYISNWSDPQITNDLGGRIVLPDKPIKVVFRSGESGTTALFYDFVANTEPALFADWAARNRFNRNVRIIDLLPGTFAPSTIGQGGSDQIASYVANTPGTIGYDEFGYAQVYGNQVAWVQNAAGNWVKPYAPNITAALESARLRPDLSQDLRNVYGSPNPGAYPISAYSYLVTQCARAADRATCTGPYVNGGVAETLTGFMRYVACDGQIQMADIGYAPLPPQLSQYVADAVGRMNGTRPERLTRGNCANPRFDPGYLLPGGETPPALPDPPGVENVIGADGGGDGGDDETAGGDGGAGGAGAAGPTTTAGTGDEEAAPGLDDLGLGGGSSDWRDVDPVAFDRPGMERIGRWPLLVVVLILAVPVVGGMVASAVRRRRGTDPSGAPP